MGTELSQMSMGSQASFDGLVPLTSRRMTGPPKSARFSNRRGMRSDLRLGLCSTMATTNRHRLSPQQPLTARPGNVPTPRTRLGSYQAGSHPWSPSHRAARGAPRDGSSCGGTNDGGWGIVTTEGPEQRVMAIYAKRSTLDHKWDSNERDKGKRTFATFTPRFSHRSSPLVLPPTNFLLTHSGVY